MHPSPEGSGTSAWKWTLARGRSASRMAVSSGHCAVGWAAVAARQHRSGQPHVNDIVSMPTHSGRFPVGEETTVSQPVRMEPVSNALRLKVGRVGGIDPIALAKAEVAMKDLANNFDRWMQDELDKLDTARSAIRDIGYTAETAERLYSRAHDLKGLGDTYGYPLVTSVAGSLCRLIQDPGKRMEAPLFLLDAHIASIKAVVRSKIRDVDNPVAQALLSELEQQVRASTAS
jgi:hypothetical protein